MLTKIEDGKRSDRMGGSAVALAEALSWMSLLAMDALKWAMEVAQRGAARLMTAQGRFRQGRQMKLVETLALGGKRQLFLVMYEGQRYMVGAGAEGVGTIVAIDAEPARAEAAKTEPVRDAGVRVAARPGLRVKDMRGLELVRHRPDMGSRKASHGSRLADAQAGLELWQ